MSDEEKTDKPKKAPTKKQFEAAMKFGHPDGSGTVKIGDVIEMTAAQFKTLPKGAVLPYMGDDE